MSASRLFRVSVLLGALGASVILSPAYSSVTHAVGDTLGLRGRAQIVSTTNSRNPANALAAAHVPHTVTNSDKGHALQILANSPTVQRLFHNVSYEVVHDGPWTTGSPGAGYTSVTLGVTLWLRLAQPSTVTGQWPVVKYPQPGSNGLPPYTSQLRPLTAHGLRTVSVEVDLARNIVAGVTPEDYVSLHR